MQLEALLNDEPGTHTTQSIVTASLKRRISDLYSDGYITPSSPHPPHPRLAVEYLTTSPTSQVESSPSLLPQPLQLPISLPVSLPLPSASGAPPASRLARSRVVGRRHRRNEQARLALLEHDVEALRLENSALQAQAEVLSSAGHHLSREYLSDARGTQHMISTSTACILGTGAIEARDALALLELLALRRNLVTVALDSNGLIAGTSAQPTLDCPDASQIELAVQNATPEGPLRLLHARWAEYEVQAPTQTLQHPHGHNLQNLSISPPLLKKCSRCGKVRAGHAKQVCDDGHNVASQIPYYSLHSLSLS